MGSGMIARDVYARERNEAHPPVQRGDLLRRQAAQHQLGRQGDADRRHARLSTEQADQRCTGGQRRRQPAGDCHVGPEQYRQLRLRDRLSLYGGLRQPELVEA